MSRDRSRSLPLLTLAALMLAGTALRVWQVVAWPLMVDEGATWEDAMKPHVTDLFWSHGMDHPPLSYVLVRFSLEIFGRSIWALRLPSFLAGVFCIVVAWQLGRRLDARGTAELEGSRRPIVTVAALLAALVAFDPLLVLQSGVARMYSLLALLTLLTLERLEALLAADERRTGPWLVPGVLLLAATWTHYMGYVLVVAFLTAAGVHSFQGRGSGSAWSRLRPALLAALLPIAGTAGPLLGLAPGGAVAPAQEGQMPGTGTTAMNAARSARLVFGYAKGVWRIGPAAPLLVLAGLAGLAVLARRSAAFALAVVTMAAVTLLAVVVGAQERPYGVVRYLLEWRLAVAIGLASLGLLHGRRTRAAATAAVTLACLYGAGAAVPRGMPGAWAVGDLLRSLAPGIESGETVAFAPLYYAHLGRWYDLPVAGEEDFPWHPDGSLPSRAWLFVEVSESQQGVLGVGRSGTLSERLDALEKAYGVSADRAGLERGLRAHGAVALAFRRGSATLHVRGERTGGT